MELVIKIDYPCICSIQVSEDHEYGHSVHICNCCRIYDENKFNLIQIDELIDNIKGHKEFFNYIETIAKQHNLSTINVKMIFTLKFLQQCDKHNFDPIESSYVVNRIYIMICRMLSSLKLNVHNDSESFIKIIRDMMKSFE